MTRKIRYLKATSYLHESLIQEMKELLRSGLYQWIQVFDGDAKLTQDVEDWEKYDVVHVNASGGDFSQIARVREKLKNSSTQLVVSLDYGVHEFGKFGVFPDVVGRELSACDKVFATEPFQRDAFQTLMPDKKVHLIPHPTDVEGVRRVCKKCPEGVVSVVHHLDGNNIVPPYLALKGLPVKRALIGYLNGADPMQPHTMNMFDRYRGYTSYSQFIGFLGWSSVVIDPYAVPNYGRALTDCAAVGIPTVASSMTDAAKRLFPMTTVNPFDVVGMREMTKKLLGDDSFRSQVVAVAEENAGFYSQSASRERFLAMLDETDVGS